MRLHEVKLLHFEYFGIRGGQIEIIFELEPADSNNLIHYTQRSIDQS